jgi:cytochrome c-type biogenesis protein CcmH/NrfF
MALLLGGLAAAAERVEIADVEDEVMCPICGTLLELTHAPQAERQRAFIAERIERGETKEEIKDALVAEYGDEVLAVPRDSGFQLSAYLVPAFAFAAAAIALAIGLWRWRGNAGGGGGGGPRGPRGEDARRLDADLARYDL